MISIQKNNYYTVDCIDLTHEGLGVAKIDTFPIFIENLLPDEKAEIKIIKVNKSFAIGRIKQLIKKSSNRVNVIDKKGTWVGTMPLQHLLYEKQLLFKQQQVKNVMSKVAKLSNVPVLSTIGAKNTTQYRNKAQIPVRMVNGQLETGFFRKNTHDLVPMTDFIIQDKVIDDIILVTRDALRSANVLAYNEREHSGELRHIMVRRGRLSKDIQVVFITRTKKSIPKTVVNTLLEQFSHIVSIMQNVNSAKTNVIMGNEMITLYGEDKITDVLLGNTYSMSAKSFYQVNPEQTEVLYKKVIDMAQLTKDDVVIDAYCGVGTIGLSLAKQVKAIYGMEIVPDAIKMAKENAKLNNITNAYFEVGAAEIIMPKWSHLKPSVVIVDPPRKGLDASFIQTTVNMAPKRIVYVSCNPSTMARDLALFSKRGYQVQYVQPVDMFPYTSHVECVVLLERK